MKTRETQYCENYLSQLGRKERIELLESSTLSDKEIAVIKLRFVNGMTVKECSQTIGMEESALNKLQRKSFTHLYEWLCKNKNADF